MSTTFQTCPACGAPEWSRFCRWTQSRHGDDVACECGYYLHQGQQLAGTRWTEPEEARAAVHAAWPGVAAERCWVAPEDRRFGLRGVLDPRVRRAAR